MGHVPRSSGPVRRLVRRAGSVVAAPARVTAAGRARLLAAFICSLLPHAGAAMPASRAAYEPVCVRSVAATERTSLWAAPLDRTVTLRLADVTVREAIDRVAGEARLELTYSAELLPTTRRVCLQLDRVPVGAVLDLLLDASALRPVVMGSAHVVLAPTRTAQLSAAPFVSRRASPLDRVVVTGSPDGAPHRGSPFALTVIDGDMLAQHHVGTLGEALELAVPGLWTWATAAGSITARYGSIRGASSFGVSAPKVYLDGIEVANPLLVTQLDASRVARVEVIRGPQGAALYGADAISGVVNILTRHDGTPDGRAQLQLSGSAGISHTAYAARDPLVQEHALSFRRGTAARSVGLGIIAGTVGAYVPGASERRVLADVSSRVTHGRVMLTGTARFSLQGADAGTGSPFTTGRPITLDSATGQDAAQYTVGASAAFMPSLRWTHTAIAGVDGYRLQGLNAVASAGPTTLAGTTAWADSDGAADRASLRWRSVGRFDIAAASLLTTTFALEQAFTRDVVSPGATAALGTVSAPGTGWGALAPRANVVTTPTRERYATTGASAQAQLSVHDRWFASAGVRAERTSGATPNTQWSLLPMLGLAWVHDAGATVWKLRSAYGTGIRPARTPLRTSSWLGAGQPQLLSSLDPERQSGYEVGADLLVGARLTLHVTRFDQRASGLIQPVATVTTSVQPNGRFARTLTSTLQNVGAIDNRGWELDATSAWGPLSLSGTLSLVDSRVARVVRGYAGDLRPGDRMLDVPARTGTLAASWSTARWRVSTSASRAEDWIAYDRAAIGSTLSANRTSPRDVQGGALRSYWRAYDAVTLWRAGVSYRAHRNVSLLWTGDNLLNVQTGLPDNATVAIGRTMLLGLRTTF